jgi:hypothetical protein
MSFSFASEDEHESVKYIYGDRVTILREIENLTLVVAFDYLSISNTDYCFNNQKITVDDFRKLFEFKKQISKIKIKDFFDDNNIKKKYHFHDIDLYKKTFLINLMKPLLNYKNFLKVENLPTIYQIGVYTDNIKMKAPRILGFFGKNATFHILWFDYEHKIYPNIK